MDEIFPEDFYHLTSLSAGFERAMTV